MGGSAMESDNRRKLMDLTLEEKIDYSKMIIEKAFKKFSSDNVYVAWTGGKDSSTMLWLFREAAHSLGLRKPKAIFIDEGSVFEEIYDFVKRLTNEWNIALSVAKNPDLVSSSIKVGDLIKVADLNDRNRKALEKIGFKEAYFSFDPESYVGTHLLKTVAMNTFMEDNRIQALTTAIRWDEQETRSNEKFFSPRSAPEHVRVHPMLHWKERDIWDFINMENVPFCSLYAKGYRSLGAKCSTRRTSDISAWKQDLEKTSERAGRNQNKEEIIATLRALGYM
jgi:phosphoadenosine phosphosulfate reductase